MHSLLHLSYRGWSDLVAIALSWACKVGMLIQIRINRKRQSVHGQSFGWVVANFASYASWTQAGFPDHSTTEIWGQLPGAVLSVVLLAQYTWYELLGKLGLRLDPDFGHYRGRKHCSICAAATTEWGLPPPVYRTVRCRQPKCHNGRVHLEIEWLGENMWCILVAHGYECDQCHHRRVEQSWLVLEEVELVLYVKTNGGPWKTVSIADSLQHDHRLDPLELPKARGGVSFDKNGTSVQMIALQPAEAPPLPDDDFSTYFERSRRSMLEPSGS